MTSKYTVAVYLSELAYGGPEEGGWWYECGELVKVICVFGSEEKAIEYTRRMNDKLRQTLNKGRREISSVLSNGVYRAMVMCDYPPRYYPERRPYYE